ncbi:non-heme iron oxygenase ferredoxin subunit [Trebonia sp.]|uniref:non-heme iron oxygenase ferredoxin subunit n=1 Tax=Trebonia sp. TaxID=2767075 RepID=UPI0026351C42|nr:non-heme iron oxygenase ferredoxin subunit [Trebonia sp.]
MTELVRACALSDLADGEPLSVELAGLPEPVAIVRTRGEVFAIQDVCSHAEVPLSEGEVDGCTIECWLHGSRFDLRSGKPTGMPATEPVPVYPVTIEGDDVLIAIDQES